MNLGLKINDARTILAGVQDTVIARRCTAALTPLYVPLVCTPVSATKTFDGSLFTACAPLAVLLAERSTPEPGLVEAKPPGAVREPRPNVQSSRR